MIASFFATIALKIEKAFIAEGSFSCQVSSPAFTSGRGQFWLTIRNIAQLTLKVNKKLRGVYA